MLKLHFTVIKLLDLTLQDNYCLLFSHLKMSISHVHYIFEHMIGFFYM